MKYYASLSYGKDSLAMLEAIHRLGYQLDGIVHAEVWATDDIHGDLPEMVAFKEKADRFIKERYGIDVEHVCATDKDGEKMTFEKYFYRVPKSKRAVKNEQFIDCIYGWPFTKGSWCLRELKLGAMHQIKKETAYIGIAADETERINNTQNRGKRLPLLDIGWSETDCMAWCESQDLVSPIYAASNRGGCWFCPKQPLSSLRTLHNEHPELWDLMLKWDVDSTVPFRADGHTIRDYDKRFKAENLGLVPKDRRFRWKTLENL